jgi:hypothetical protein
MATLTLFNALKANNRTLDDLADSILTELESHPLILIQKPKFIAAVKQCSDKEWLLNNMVSLNLLDCFDLLFTYPIAQGKYNYTAKIVDANNGDLIIIKTSLESDNSFTV